MTIQTKVMLAAKDGLTYFTCANRLCDRVTTGQFCCDGCERAYLLQGLTEGPTAISHTGDCDKQHERVSSW